MAENKAEQKKAVPGRTEFSQIGRAKALEVLFEGSGYTNSVRIAVDGGVASHKIMAQGVDFDLIYTPLKHLGYKAVLNVTGEIYAAFHRPKALSIVLGVSAHFCLEDIKELWSGVLVAAKEHGFENLSLNLVPSVNGLQISLMATGVQKKSIRDKKPAPKSMDLICLSGNVGGAYMGQHVLEREKGAFLAAGQDTAKQPDLSKYKYILAQYLCPEIPANVIDRFAEHKIVPSAGVFDCRGLAEAVHELASATGFGAKIYLDKIPIATQTFDMASEIQMDPVTAALNGGDDYRLMFTVPIEQFELFHKEIQTFDVIGHLSQPEVGSVLVTPDGAEIPLRGLDGKDE